MILIGLLEQILNLTNFCWKVVWDFVKCKTFHTNTQPPIKDFSSSPAAQAFKFKRCRIFSKTSIKIENILLSSNRMKADLENESVTFDHIGKNWDVFAYQGKALSLTNNNPLLNYRTYINLGRTHYKQSRFHQKIEQKLYRLTINKCNRIICCLTATIISFA